MQNKQVLDHSVRMCDYVICLCVASETLFEDLRVLNQLRWRTFRCDSGAHDVIEEFISRPRPLYNPVAVNLAKLVLSLPLSLSLALSFSVLVQGQLPLSLLQKNKNNCPRNYSLSHAHHEQHIHCLLKACALSLLFTSSDGK